MSEVKFYKLTLELNSKLNKEKLNLLEKIQDIVEAKSKFNQASEGSKRLVILNLTKHSVNLMLRLNNHPKQVGIRTINRFICILQQDFNWKTAINNNTRQFFKVSDVKAVESDKCRAVVDALYSEGNEFISPTDLENLFCDIEETIKEAESNDSIENQEEYTSISLENASEKISALIGNAEFKKEIQYIVKFAEFSKPLNNNDSKVFPYHYIFKGAAGMEHTIPAKLMAEVFYHLGLVKNRKFAVLNIPEEGNQYAGISLEDSINVSETGIVFVEGIFDCENENISPKKVLAKLAEKMEQYKGKLLFIISYQFTDDKGSTYKTLIDGICPKVNCRLVDFPDFNNEEMVELIEASAKKTGCSISLEAIKLIGEYLIKQKGSKGFNIEKSIYKLIEKAFSDKVFAAFNNEADLKTVSCLETRDFNFLDTPADTTVIKGAHISELDAMIGLGEVKSRVQQICNVLTVRAKKKELGIKSKQVCLHMQFVGNPGTGKTTVARIMGKVLRDLGFLSSGHFVELTRNDLIGEYIGQTTPKVRKAIKKAKGGIMFIDEAYSLYQGAENDYGHEAVSELIKSMEDFKDDMVVIFAGYPKEMAKMVGMNPGLRDRIAFTIEFPDYKPEDLVSIFMKMCEDNSYTVCYDAKKMLTELFERLFAARNESFGNARIIRKIFERIEIIQNSRICEQNNFNSSDIGRIDVPDIRKLYEDPEIQSILKNTNNIKTIGFKQCI